MTTIALVNPATEATLRTLELAGAEDVDEAVTGARGAFGPWSRSTPTERAFVLRAIGDAITEHAEELALLETRNVGKPIAESRSETAMAAEVFYYYAGAVDKHLGNTIPVAHGVDFTLYSPLGVVGIIVPWNFPLAIAAWNIAPALACGNTVVVKPSELTPLTAHRLVELADHAGLPPGVLTVVVGTGSEAGARLVEHPHVAKITFTGSTAVGKQIMRSAASTMKRLTLELGGKASNIVFADADLELAAEEAVTAVFSNSGQDCCSRGRILVEGSAYDRFMAYFLDACARFTVGNPEDSSTAMGPLISRSHRDRVSSFLTGDDDVAFCGEAPEGAGFWFPPTVVANPSPTSRLVQDEIFGPIATVTPFSSEAEAIEIANNTPYGLSGSVWCRDGARALRVARALEAGAISVNSNNAVRVSTPFGGFKQSGFGRELGMAAMASYSELKNVYMRLD